LTLFPFNFFNRPIHYTSQNFGYPPNPTFADLDMGLPFASKLAQGGCQSKDDFAKTLASRARVL